MNREPAVSWCLSCAMGLAFMLAACNESGLQARQPASAGMRSTTQAQRWAARTGQSAQRSGVNLTFGGLTPGTAKFSPLASGLTTLASMSPPGGPADIFGVANYANSPLQQTSGGGAAATATVDLAAGSPTLGQVTAVTVAAGGAAFALTPTVTLMGGGGTGATATAVVDTAAGSLTYQQVTAVTVTSAGTGYTSAPSVVIAGTVVPGSGMRKFVDTLPRLCAVSGPNNLGQCLPIATPLSAAATAAAGVPADGDYYQLQLGEYSQKLHSDLPATKLRGYTDMNALSAAGTPVYQFLGPIIVATRNRPVRISFTNALATGPAGQLFVPTDRTYMGAGNGPDGTPYSENRATLHLHGGNTPWISDGTPHQWTVPAGEQAFTNFDKGLSATDVPDMPATGPGQLSFYWTNQQSGRFMFYHDHAYGITRLNVYAGEAAGYVLVDPVQEDNLALATVPGTLGATPDLAHYLPLVIQDKTFVPDNGAVGGQLAATDPTWDVARWGGMGSLWVPHVYTPNQNPADVTGANAYGRWDYGAWFWPAQNAASYVAGGLPTVCASAAFATVAPAFPPLMCPGTPALSGAPEGYNDTPLVNGTAYPSTTVEAGAYRVHLLNASNDRVWNLSLYYATTAAGVVCKGSAVADLSTCTEVAMLPASAHTAASTLPSCATVTPLAGAGLAIADTTGGAPINGTGLPSLCWPSTWPTDNRVGGVPDPTTAGPAIVQIGSEGGLLPGPAVIPSTPINFDYYRRNITVLNVLGHGMMPGPAERVDMVVDFTNVPQGSALILYNDGVAPMPAIDPRNDYFTGDPDLSPTGGAPSTPAGYGPNTRTVMQFKVQGTSTNLVPFNLAALKVAQPSIFALVQEPIILPGTPYPAGNGGAPANTYVRIQDTSIAYFDNGSLGGLTLTSGGTGYTSAPTVVIAPPPCAVGTAGCTQATATATLAGSVASLTLVPNTSRYTTLPAITFSGGGGTGALAVGVLAPTTVASVALVPSGKVYRSAPTITLTPPCVGCVAATATAVMRADRTIRSVTVVNPVGTTYTTAPLVTVSGGGATGVSGTATLAPSTLVSVTLTSGGAGYTTAPLVVVARPRVGPAPTATASLGAMAVSSVTLDVGGGGLGYTAAPLVSITGGGGTGAAAVAAGQTKQLLPKTIQELFTLDYGRMNATMGVELPFTNFLTQTTIPYGYTDPPTEMVKPGEVQFWKITHNGVDTHFMHFHVFSVQLVNRVGWDGAIKTPDTNELGWKDTVRMNPLEDVVVALRPYIQTLPWKLPNSVRPLDVTKPIGSALPNQFTNIDPSNQPAAVTNDLTNFGAEFAWHCHVLGHEENDMMRSLSLVVSPEAPSGLTATVAGRSVTLAWTDNALNETGFTVQRAQLNQTTNLQGPWVNVGLLAQNVTTVTDRPTTGTYTYQVVANNLVGYQKAYAAPVTGYPTVSGDSTPSNRVSVVVP